MGLLDKMKDQATQALEKATQATVAGQAKLDTLANKKRIDGLLRQIGFAVYQDQTGKQALDTAQIEALVSQVSQLEASSGIQVSDKHETDDDSGGNLA